MNLIAPNGSPLTFELGGGIDSRTNTFNPAVTASRDPAARPWGVWEDLVQEISFDGGVAFRLNNTPYCLTAENGGGGTVSTNRTEINAWETFFPLAFAGGIVYLTWDRAHVLAVDEYNVVHARTLFSGTIWQALSPRPAADPRHLHGAVVMYEPDGERIWTPAYGTRDDATRARWRAAIARRKYDAVAYQISGKPYRDDWGELPVDPDHTHAMLLELKNAGFTTSVSFDDTRWPDLSYLRDVANATQDVVDWVFGVPEVRDVVRDPNIVLSLLAQGRALWPHARLGVHFGQNGESYGVGGAPFWHACVDRAGLDCFFLEWGNGQWDTPDAAISRMGDFVTRLVGGDNGYPILPCGVCLWEVSTLPTYNGQWSEARAVALNDRVLAEFDGHVQDGNPHARLPLMGCMDGLTVA